MKAKFIALSIIVAAIAIGGVAYLVKSQSSSIETVEETIDSLEFSVDSITIQTSQESIKLAKPETLLSESISVKSATKPKPVEKKEVVIRKAKKRTVPKKTKSTVTKKVTSTPTKPSPTDQIKTSSTKKTTSEMAQINLHEQELLPSPAPQPKLEKGISVSLTILLEETYYKAHDLNKAQKIAMKLLSENPDNPIAKKILKLIEYEKLGYSALQDGNSTLAIQYFEKMQELDPNNKWAKKGIIKAQLGG